jgi:hypothetical protein
MTGNILVSEQGGVVMGQTRRRLRANATAVVSTLVTGIWLAALFTGQDWWLAFMLLGYVAIVPLTALLFGDEEETGAWDNEEVSVPESEASSRRRKPNTSKGGKSPDESDPLQTLRNRYASGELTDQEFEEKLERLLETEDIERPGTRGADLADDPIERDLQRERE